MFQGPGALADPKAYRAIFFEETQDHLSDVEAILLKLTDESQHALVTDLKYYAFNEVTVAGHDVILARTGYTGEDGFELFLPNEGAASLWESVAQAGEEFGIVPCGLASRDSLRLEAGMPLYGNELSLERSPFDGCVFHVTARPASLTRSPATVTRSTPPRGDA